MSNVSTEKRPNLTNANLIDMSAKLQTTYILLAIFGDEKKQTFNAKKFICNSWGFESVRLSDGLELEQFLSAKCSNWLEGCD